MSIVHHDIRWGLFGLTINENYISTMASDGFGGEYDLDADLSQIQEFAKEDLLNRLIGNVEVAINWGKYEEIGELIQECVLEYVQLFPLLDDPDRTDSDVSDFSDSD